MSSKVCVRPQDARLRPACWPGLCFHFCRAWRPHTLGPAVPTRTLSQGGNGSCSPLFTSYQSPEALIYTGAGPTDGEKLHRRVGPLLRLLRDSDTGRRGEAPPKSRSPNPRSPLLQEHANPIHTASNDTPHDRDRIPFCCGCKSCWMLFAEL